MQQPCSDSQFLFMMAFISAWHTNGYLVSSADGAHFAHGSSSSPQPHGKPL